MNRADWPEDPDTQETVLSFNEIIRQWEELQYEFPDLESNLPAEVQARWDSFLPVAEGMRAGKITIAAWEDDIERVAEELRDSGEVGPVMALRAQKEAELKAPGGLLGQQLAHHAFTAASRGLGEPEWVERVMERFPHSPRQPGPLREAYERRIALLRREGPWPWPRGE